jgi:LPPG:FO 2-phospho-L-lactate transferase
VNDKFTVNNELKKFYDLNFMIGDKDLALNLFRNQMLNDGFKLTEITDVIKNKFNIRCKILPMSDDKVSTKLITKNGDKLNFQNYFVEKKAKPRLSKVVYEGSRKARVSNQVLNLINQSDILIVGPSNPILSIGPILSINRINQAIKDHNNVIAISPFVGKKALKGPSVQNFKDIGYKPDIQGLKKYYKNRVNKFYVHHGDSDNSSNVFEEQIIFKNENDSKNLANRILQNE